MDECHHHTHSPDTRNLESSLPEQGRDGLPDYCGVGDLHHFCGGLSLLRGKKHDRADATRSARDTHLLHDLPAVQQLDDSLRVEIPGARRPRGLFWVLVSDDSSGRFISVWHRTRMAPADLRARAYDFDESVRDYVLFARGAARVSRHRGLDPAECRFFVWAGRARWMGTIRAGGSAFDVLA